ncbi:NAD-dependent ADP-ribosyltransferase [Acetobacteraceae bacterium EV16G]|uniref:NAD-dependent ADP-ribosyltransferase n=1 Tax=Sorlinia euscelidii TaxID=3081148 RepID=A0ABU7U5V9_9PROT
MSRTLFINRLIIAALVFFSFSCANALPVKKVFRAESRPPSDVFASGFTSWGDNINVNAHVLGLSGGRGSRDSAFIPTTSNPDIAHRFAIDLLNVASGATSYIYNIRPDANFYSASTSIYNIYEHATPPRRVSDQMRATMAREQEWFVPHHIPPEQIQSVTIYTRVDGVIHETTMDNDRYVPGDTHSNDDPYPSAGQYPITSGPIRTLGASMTNVDTEQPGNNWPLPTATPSTLLNCFGCVFHSEL